MSEEIKPEQQAVAEEPVVKQVPEQVEQQRAPRETLEQLAEPTPEDEAYLEEAREFGDFYVALTNHLCGQRLEQVQPQNEFQNAIVSSVKQHAEKQQQMFVDKRMTARTLLEQAFPQPQQQQLFDDNSKYYAKELSPGIHAVFINSDTYRNLRFGAQAVAAKIRDGVSFVIIPEYGADVNNEEKQRHLKENISHETHHIAWSFLRSDGLVQTDESEPEMRNAFAMYQEELVAKLCSDGSVTSYSHLNVIGKDGVEQLDQKDPGVTDDIYAKTGAMNRLLEELELVRRRSGVRKQDLILPTIQAGTFDQLATSIRKMKAFAELSAKPEEKPKNRGWDIIDTI